LGSLYVYKGREQDAMCLQSIPGRAANSHSRIQRETCAIRFLTLEVSIPSVKCLKDDFVYRSTCWATRDQLVLPPHINSQVKIS